MIAKVFANPGPEKKYEAWSPAPANAAVGQAAGDQEDPSALCRSLSEVYCVPEGQPELGPKSTSFGVLSLEKQAAWTKRCEGRVGKFDDEQLKQFDACIGCVSDCSVASDCLAGVDLCEP